MKEANIPGGMWKQPARLTSVANEEDFNRMLASIRDRPSSACTGFWFNLIEYRGNQFLQGEIVHAASQGRELRHVAALVEGVRPEDIEGFWPEIQGYPVEKWEEDLLASYLSRQGSNDLELIVPERNRERSVPWERFDGSPEFETYSKFIYPAVIDALETIEARLDVRRACL